MVEDDATAQLPARLRAQREQVDLLLWDLVDERLGVYLQDGGGVVTRSVELVTAQRQSNRQTPGRLVEYDTSEHFMLWSQALGHWISLLRELELLDRTILLAPAWAERTTGGARTPSSFGLSAKQATRATARYVAEVRRQSLVPVIEVSRENAWAADDHRWGVAPFHYDAEIYRYIWSAVDRMTVPA